MSYYEFVVLVVTWVSCVFSAQHTHATDFFLKLWYDSIVKCILDNFSRDIIVQAVKNVHDPIFITWV